MTFYHTTKETRSSMSVPVAMAYMMPVYKAPADQVNVVKRNYDSRRFDMEFMGLPPVASSRISKSKELEVKPKTLDLFL
jgi:hypothetical protein